MSGVCAVRLRWDSGSLPRSLGRSLLQAVLSCGLRHSSCLRFPHSKPAKPALWCNRSVMVPFLRHPLSSGFLGKTKIFYNREIFFSAVGGEKKIKPSSNRCHRQGMFRFQRNTPPNIPRPPKLFLCSGLKLRFRLPALKASFPLRFRLTINV